MTWVLLPSAVLLWALVVHRARIEHRTLAQKVMTATVATLAAGVSLRLPWLWHEMISLLGVPGAVTVRHLLTVSTETLVLVFVRQITARGPRLVTIVWVACVASAALVAVAPWTSAPSTAQTYIDLGRLYTSSVPWLVQWSITIVYAIWAFGVGTLFYWRYQRRAGTGPAGRGVLLIGIGTAIALLITCLKAGVVLSAVMGRQAMWDGWPAKTPPLLIGALLAAVVAGLVTSAAMFWWSRWTSRRDHHQSVVALEPLWRMLTTVVPNITLEHRALVTLMGPRVSARDFLYRRVIEIHDGLLALAPYTSDRVWQAAYGGALSRGSSPEEASRAGDVAALLGALEAYQDDRRASERSLRLVSQQLLDLPAEVARLSRLADELPPGPRTRARGQAPHDQEVH